LRKALAVAIAARSAFKVVSKLASVGAAGVVVDDEPLLVAAGGVETVGGVVLVEPFPPPTVTFPLEVLLPDP
jgi:hypothetical protein